MTKTQGVFEKLKVLDLFSGIGGFSLGLESTGYFETVAFCEWDEKCKLVLQKHWPNTLVFGDIKNVCGHFGWVTDGGDSHKSALQVDVIVGGFPCQDISSSGSKRGLEGGRSIYWFEFLRLIGEVLPKGVIIENVAALQNRGLHTVLKGLASIGYDAEWYHIAASETGASHKRDRLFILAYPTGIGQQEQGGCLEPISTTPDTYREASGIVDAVQRAALPYVCGGHDGVSPSVDRLKQLGNAVCPLVVAHLGRYLYKRINSE